MKFINILFDGDFDDVDIISVPDRIINDIESVTQEFFNWAIMLESGCWKGENERKICCVDTEDFIKWFNKFKACENEFARIVETHVQFNPEYPVIEF